MENKNSDKQDCIELFDKFKAEYLDNLSSDDWCHLIIIFDSASNIYNLKPIVLKSFD